MISHLFILREYHQRVGVEVNRGGGCCEEEEQEEREELEEEEDTLHRVSYH